METYDGPEGPGARGAQAPWPAWRWALTLQEQAGLARAERDARCHAATVAQAGAREVALYVLVGELRGSLSGVDSMQKEWAERLVDQERQISALQAELVGQERQSAVLQAEIERVRGLARAWRGHGECAGLPEDWPRQEVLRRCAREVLGG